MENFLFTRSITVVTGKIVPIYEQCLSRSLQASRAEESKKDKERRRKKCLGLSRAVLPVPRGVQLRPGSRVSLRTRNGHNKLCATAANASSVAFNAAAISASVW